MILKITKRTGSNFDFITANVIGTGKEISLAKVVKKSDEVGTTFSQDGTPTLENIGVGFEGYCDADFYLSVNTDVFVADNLGNIYFQIIND